MVSISEELVARLIHDQVPQWRHLPVKKVIPGGWDNRTFRLGERMLVRVPRAEEYIQQIPKERTWLPRFTPLLSVQIPTLLFVGEPGHGYPWHWGVYRWIPGTTAADAPPSDMAPLAGDVASFLRELQSISTHGCPAPGPYNFSRGCPLDVYDGQTCQALEALEGSIDTKQAFRIWHEAKQTTWNRAPVWVHGDVSAGNILVCKGRLHGVIDFGSLAVGDPACDAMIAWQFFDEEGRHTLCRHLGYDEATWLRGRAWALWKAAIVAAGIVQSNAVEMDHCWRTLARVVRG